MKQVAEQEAVLQVILDFQAYLVFQVTTQVHPVIPENQVTLESTVPTAQ